MSSRSVRLGWPIAGAVSAAIIPPVVVVPTPTLTLTAASAQNEGNSGTTLFRFVLTLSAASTAAIPYTWGSAGSGANQADGADFGGSFPSGSGTFAPGETSKNIDLLVLGDLSPELAESFVVNVTSTGAGNASATGTILDDDTSTAPGGSITLNYLFIGSSTPEKMFTLNTGPANTNVNVWSGTAMVPMGTTGGGSTVFGDQLVQKMLAAGYSSVTVNCFNFGKGGTTVIDHINDAGSIRTNAINAVIGSGLALNGIIHICGLNDAANGLITSQAQHKGNIDTELGLYRSALGANIPVIFGISQDYYTTDATTPTTDNTWRWLHAAELAASQDPHNYFGTHVYDLPQIDGTHMDTASYPIHATRLAYNVGQLALGLPVNRGPLIVDAVAVYSTMTRVRIVHGTGTDIGTTDYQTGWKVAFGAGAFGTVGVYAVRHDATHVDVYHPDSGGGIPTLNFMDGVTPNNSISFYDNATPPMPCSMTNVDIVAPAGTTAVDPSPPVTTFTDNFDYADGQLLTAHGWTSPAGGQFATINGEVYGSVIGNVLAPFIPKTANYDVFAVFVPRTVASGNTALLTHYQAETDFLYDLLNSGTNWQIAKTVNGSPSTAPGATGLGPVPVAGQAYNLEINVRWEAAGTGGASFGAHGGKTTTTMKIDGTVVYAAIVLTDKAYQPKGRIGLRQSGSVATATTKTGIRSITINDVFL